MNRIAILTDSSADLTNEQLKEYNIDVIRMPINIDGVDYLDEIEIDYDTFVDKMKNNSICKTSQPRLGEFKEKVDQLLKEYDVVLSIPISKGLSGTYNSILTLSKEYNDKLIVIDSNHIACLLGDLCIQTRMLLNKGKTPLEIKELIERDSYMWTCILPDDLIYLKRGGRISTVSALLGNLIKLVPLLVIEHGVFNLYSKVRTYNKAIQTLLDITKDLKNPSNYNWYVAHAACEDKAIEIAKELKDIVKQDIKISKLGSVIMSHTGPNTVGIGYVKKIGKCN